MLALGTGDGQTDVEVRITTDLGARPLGARAEGMYNRQLAADYLLRVASPTQPFAGLDRLARVRRDPGRRGADRGAAVLPAGAAPSPSRARAMHWSRGEDEVSYLTPADEIPGVDASVLAQDTKASATVLGIGITYSNPGRFREGGRGLPVDASWSYERMVRRRAGIVPDRAYGSGRGSGCTSGSVLAERPSRSSPR